MLLGAPGIEVQAIDRLALGEEAEAGTGLNVGPNAMKALRLHLPARHDAVRDVALPWQRWFIDMADDRGWRAGGRGAARRWRCA